MKKIYLILFALLFTFSANFAQSVIISPTGDGGFESGTSFAANGWIPINDGTNKWYVGTAAKTLGLRGAYIDNGTGTTNVYTTNNGEVSYIYKDVVFPAGATNITLSFKWRAVGENGSGADSYDFLRVFLPATTVTPVAGILLATNPTNNIIGTGKYYLSSPTAFSTVVIPLASVTYAGTTKRLIFCWRNDNSVGNQPPAAIDEVSLTYTPACTPPSISTQPSTSAKSYCLNSTSTDLSVTAGGTGISYQWYKNTTNSNSGGTSLGTANGAQTASYTPQTNAVGTLYYYVVVSGTCTPAATSNVSGAITVNALPVAGTITGAAGICPSSTITLSPNATGAGTLTYAWNSSNTAVANVNSAGLVTAVSAGSTNISYTVTDGNTCSATSADFAFKVSPSAGDITSAGNVTGACVGNTVAMTSHAAGIGPFTYTWNSSNPSVASVSATGVVSALTLGNTNITYTVTDGNGCTATSFNFAFAVTAPTANDITGPTQVCINNSISLTPHATGSGTLTYTWASSNTAAATVSGSGVVSGVSAGSTDITYTVKDGNGCTATSAAYPVTVNPLPSVATGAVGGSTCGTGPVTISVADPGAGFTIDWYAGFTGGSALVSGTTTYITPNISATTNYYAEVRNTSTGCVSASRLVVTATFNALPASPTSPVNNAICGPGTATISATPPSGSTIDWYDAATGGNLLLSGSNSYTTPSSISTTTTYYAEARNTTSGCKSSGRTAVTITVNTVPNPPAGVDNARCGTGTVALSASLSGAVIDWYANPTGGTAILLGNNNFTTLSISTTTIYYAESRDAITGCLSATRTPVTATVNSKPPIPTGAVGASRCGPGSVTLSVDNPGAGFTIDWYAGATGGVALASGTISFTTPNISANTNYYAEVKNTTTGCVSATRLLVTATINPVPAVISITGPSNICNGTSATLLITVSGPGTITGILSDGTTFSGTSVTPISVIVYPVAATTYTVASLTNGTCSAQASDLVASKLVSINPSPTGKISGSTSVCLNAGATLNIAVTGTGTISGVLSDGTTFSGTAPDISVIVNPASTTAYTITSLTDASLCAGIPADLTGSATVTIKPKPVASGTNMNQTGLCSGSPIATVVLTSIVPSTVFNWTKDHPEVTGITSPNSGNISGSLTLPVATTNPVMITFTVTPVADGCFGDAIYPKVTVNPIPVLSSALTAAGRCNNKSITYTATSETTGSTFTWSRAAVAGILPATASGTGANITETLSNDNSTNSTINVVYKINITANGCTNTQYVTVPVYSTLSTLTIDESQIICFGSSTYPLTATITGGNAPDFTYDWQISTRFYIGFLGIYGPWSGWSSTGITTPTITPATPGVLTQIRYQLVLKDKCGTTLTSNSVTITLGAEIGNMLNDPKSATICSETGTFTETVSLDYSIGENFGGSVDYKWQSQDPGFISSPTVAENTTYGSPVSPDFYGIADFQGHNPTNAVITKNLVIIPTAHNPLNSCNLSSIIVPVTINPVPKILPRAITVCSGSPFDATPVNGVPTAATVVPINTTYKWTVGAVPAGISGVSVPGTGVTSISQTLTNSTNGVLQVVYHVTPTYNNQCPGNSFDLTVNVNPTPTIAVVSDQTLCNGAPTTTINFSINPSAGSSILWTNDQPSIGLPASGNTDIASFNAINNTAFPIIANLKATPSSTTGGVTCSSSTSATFKIVVNPTPNLTKPGNQTVCNGSNTAQVNFISSTLDANTYYSWTNDNTSIGLAATGTTDPITGNNIPQFMATNLSTTGIPATATITVTPHYGSLSGCPGQAKTFSITVNPTLLAGNITGKKFICLGSSEQFTTDGNSGGLWSSSIPSIATVSPLGVVTGQTSGTTIISYKTSGCNGDNTSYYNVTITYQGQWLGTISSDWNTPGNWGCATIPTNSTNVIIPVIMSPNSYPEVQSIPSAMAHNITIAAGANLTISSGQTLQVSGALTSVTPGSVDAVNGTIEFNGLSLQSFSGSIFVNKTINYLKISNTTLNLSNTANDTLNITGSVSFGKNNSTFNTNDNLTLKSTLINTASDMTNGDGFTANKITGNVNVERYIPAHKSWRFMAIPTNSGQTIHQAWQENQLANVVGTPGRGTQITANAVPSLANGLDMKSVSPSMKYYDPNSDTYVGVTNTIASFDPSKGGYLTFIRGDRSANAISSPESETTLRTKGQLNNGLPFSISVVANKFIPVNNPYASSIDLTKIMQASLNKDNIQFYVYDPRLGAAYAYGGFHTLLWDNINNTYYTVPASGIFGAPYNADPNIIQSGQAFWVSSSTVSETLPLDESKKAFGNTSGILFRAQGPDEGGRVEQLGTSLFISNSNHTLVDGTLQQFNKDYFNSLDGMDAKKLVNPAENLSIKTANKLLIVERRAPFSTQDTVYYNMTGMRAQNYQFQFDAQGLSTFGVEGWVEDTYLHTKTQLNLEGATTVDFSVTNVAGSYASNRFRIVFKAAAGPLPVTIVSVKATQKDADIAVEWKVDNQSNMKAYQVEKSLDGNRFNNVGTIAANANNASVYNFLDKNAPAGYNYYRIRSIGKDGQETVTQIVRVLIQRGIPQITIHPNPITNGVINLHLINEPAGMYGIRLLNPLGQTIVSKQVSHAEGTSTEKIDWNYNLAHGVYQLEVTRPDASVKVIKVMY